MNIPFVSKGCQQKFLVRALSAIKICTYRAAAALRQEEAVCFLLQQNSYFPEKDQLLQNILYLTSVPAIAMLVQASRKQTD